MRLIRPRGLIGPVASKQRRSEICHLFIDFGGCTQEDFCSVDLATCSEQDWCNLDY